MKKIFTLFLFIAIVTCATAQILSRSENWPNAGWTVSGTYTPAALVLNPTINSQFKYDAALAVPLGGAASIYITSPFFSLKPAFDGGQKAFILNFNISFQTFANSVLFGDYWNADSSSWINFADAETQTISDFSTCSNLPVNLLLDFAGFTTNQLQNFRYRFGVVDAGNKITGVCMNSLVLASFQVLPPSSLNVTDITTTSATLNWVGNSSFGTDTSYELEFGPQGFSLGTGNHFQNAYPPFPISGLNPGANYTFYVRENVNNQSTIYTNYTGPRSFTTATLSLEEKELKGFKLYPNPAKDIVWMESVKTLNEIKLYNSIGQELKNIKPNKANANIDLSTLSTGFYFIKVTTDNDSGVYKILKN